MAYSTYWAREALREFEESGDHKALVTALTKIVDALDELDYEKADYEAGE